MPRNGTVVSVASNGVVKVSFPAIPADPGPPPLPAQDAAILLYDASGDALATFRAAFAADGGKVDTTGTAPDAGVVTAHR